jgi:hypothetical protein
MKRSAFATTMIKKGKTLVKNCNGIRMIARMGKLFMYFSVFALAERHTD